MNERVLYPVTNDAAQMPDPEDSNMPKHSKPRAVSMPNRGDCNRVHPSVHLEKAARNSVESPHPICRGFPSGRTKQEFDPCHAMNRVSRGGVDGLQLPLHGRLVRIGEIGTKKALSLGRSLGLGFCLAWISANAYGSAPGYRIAGTALEAFLSRLGQSAADSLIDAMVGREAVGLRVPVWIAAWNHKYVACDISSDVPLGSIGKSPEWSRRIDRTERFRVMFISAVPRVIEEATLWSGSRYVTRTATLLPRVRSLKRYCRYPHGIRIEESSYTLGAQAIVPDVLSRRIKASQSWRVEVMSMRSQLHGDCEAEDSPRVPVLRVVDVRSWNPTYFRLENTHAPSMRSDGVVILKPAPEIFTEHLAVPGVVGFGATIETFPWEEYNRERASIIHGGKRYPFPMLGSAPLGASFVPPLMSMEASLTELERRFNFAGQYHGEYPRVMDVANPFEIPGDMTWGLRPAVVQDAVDHDLSE